MTRDDIIRMAREAGFNVDNADFITAPKSGRIGFQLELERFFQSAYTAGAAAEREACAKVCEHQPHWRACAAAIRARGQE